MSAPAQRARGERGQVLVLFTLAIVFIMLSAAIVVDLGVLRNNRQTLANAFDAGVLAGGTLLPVDGCTDPQQASVACAHRNTAAVTAIRTRIQTTVGENYPGIATSDYTITYFCLIGVDGTGAPFISRDVPDVCNPRNALGHAPTASDFRGAGSTRFSACDPSLGDKCNAVRVTGAIDTEFSFSRVVGIQSGIAVASSTACNGPCGQAPAVPVDLVVLIDRTASMSSTDVQNTRDAARAVLGVYDPAQQRIALGFLGPSDPNSSCNGSGGPSVQVETLQPGSAVAPSYVAGSSAANTGSGTTTLSVGKPTGVAEGHFLLAGITVSGGSNTTITPPSGWTLVTRTNNSTNLALATYYHWVAAADPANWTWTFGSSVRATAGIVAWSGVDTATPIDVSGGQTGSDTASPYRPTAPSVSPTMARTGLTGFYAIANGTTFSGNSLLTERVDTRNSNNSGPSLQVATGTRTNSGATGTSYATSGLGGSYAAQHVAIRPMAAATYGTAYPADVAKWIPIGFTGTDSDTPAPAWNEAYSDGNGTVSGTTHLGSAIACFDNPGGTGTNLATPVAMAAQFLQAHGRPHVKWGILLETDGQPSYSSTGDASNYTCAAAASAAAAAKAITNADGDPIQLFTVGFGLDGNNDTDCPDSTGTYRNKNVTRLLADMASTSYAPVPDGVNSGCVSAENADADTFFCQPRASDLTAIFQSVATQLAGIRTHLVQLYPPPIVTAVSPASGSRTGGTTVTISGKHFTGATSVTWGGTGVAFTVLSDTSIRVTAPAGTAGRVVDIVVTTEGGSSPITPADQFRYT